MAYIGVSPSNGVRRVHTYTATASQTIFSGAGAEGTTLSYKDSNFVDVYQNGIKLADADYTSTSGTQIVLAQAASVDDIVVVVVFDVFSVADTVSKADGGTFDGAVTFAATATFSGSVVGISSAADDITAGDAAVNLTTTSGNITIDAQGNDTDIIFKGTDNNSDITMLTLDGSEGGFATLANGLDVADGNISFAAGHGIDFSNASGSASGSASALLDDYEEGTWTPQLTDGSTNIGTTVGSAIYTKIGDVVHCEFNIQRNDSASNTNYMQVSGLPFAHASIPALVGQAWIDNTSGDVRSFLYLPSGNTSLYFAIAGSSGDYVRLNTLVNDRYIYAGFQYKV